MFSKRTPHSPIKTGRTRSVALDPCNTIFDKNRQIRIGKFLTYPLLPTAKETLLWWRLCGHNLYCVCRVQQGKEKSVRGHFWLHGLLGDVFLPNNIFFCHEEKEKAKILDNLYKRDNRSLIDLMIDGSADAINTSFEEAEKLVLFMNGANESEREKLTCDAYILSDWEKIKQASNLPLE